jgi:hypothetical protein
MFHERFRQTPALSWSAGCFLYCCEIGDVGLDSDAYPGGQGYSQPPDCVRCAEVVVESDA